MQRTSPTKQTIQPTAEKKNQRSSGGCVPLRRHGTGTFLLRFRRAATKKIPVLCGCIPRNQLRMKQQKNPFYYAAAKPLHSESIIVPTQKIGGWSLGGSYLPPTPTARHKLKSLWLLWYVPLVSGAVGLFAPLKPPSLTGAGGFPEPFFRTPRLHSCRGPFPCPEPLRRRHPQAASPWHL